MKTLLLNTIDNVPVPYYKGKGVNIDLLNYLTSRYEQPSLIDSRLKNLTPQSLYQSAHKIAFLINSLEQSVDENNNPYPLDYREVEFGVIRDLINNLYEEWEWEGNTLRQYATEWRMFFKYLTKNNVAHNMIFPERTASYAALDKDEDYYSHTRKFDQHGNNNLKETAVPDSFCVQKEDYRENVISMNDWFNVYAELYELDPVYAVMAATMLKTFLRVGGIMQWQLAPQSGRPWKRYKEMVRDGDEFQMFKYIKKGQSKAECIVDLSTMQTVHEEYLDKLYDERFELYKKKYLKKKYKTAQQRNKNQKWTWLNKNGTPVSIRELQAAFKKVSKKLGIKVTPHTLRHTGATQILYRYGELKGIAITEANAPGIHNWLRIQLGHSRLSTTILYIKTVHRLQSEKIMVNLIPDTLPSSLESLSKAPKASLQKAMESHKEFFRGVEKRENYLNMD